VTDLERRVSEIVAATFGVPVASITLASGSESIDTWDSINHLHLVVALESELDVSFDPEVAVELTTVRAIVDAVERARAPR
jgi:acyl carrier protein